MKNLIFLCTAVLLVAACDKIGKTTVSGKVINAVTGKPIPNVKIQMEKRVPGPGVVSFGSGAEVFYHGNTDSDGEFYAEFNESGRSNSEPTCYITSSYFDTLKFYTSATEWGTNDQAPIKFHQDNDVTLRVAPMAYLALGIHNVNYVDDKDSIVIRGYNYAINWGPQPTDIPLSFTGNAQINGGSQDIPMGWLHLKWDVTRQGVTTYHHDSIWCKAGALTLYQINY